MGRKPTIQLPYFLLPFGLLSSYSLNYSQVRAPGDDGAEVQRRWWFRFGLAHVVEGSTYRGWSRWLWGVFGRLGGAREGFGLMLIAIMGEELQAVFAVVGSGGA